MTASYPTSLKVYTAKADGETIYGAHMNAVQEEIVAIETVLGTSPQGASGTVKARIAAVESGKAATSHNHSHNSLTGLTTGDPHTQYLTKAIATTKGDILAATGSAVLARLGVGTDGQVLTADSAQASGLKWSGSSETEVFEVMTTAARTALSGGDLRDGRAIWDTDLNEVWVYNSGVGWEAVGSGTKSGTYASRPAAGKDGALYLATDRKTLYVDLGSAWRIVGTVINDDFVLPDASALDVTLTYTGSDITQVDYKDGATLRVRETLTYSSGSLSTVAKKFYDTDGTTVLRTITETMNYTGDDLTSVTKVES